MAPITTSSRLPAALADLLATRDSRVVSKRASAQALAPMAARFHSTMPAVVSRTLPSTVHDAPSRAFLRARQATDTVPGQYPSLNDGPDAGTVVGIVLGSVGGFLVFLLLMYTCLHIGGRGDTVSSYGTASVVTRKARRKHSHHRRSPSRRETIEIRTTRPPPPRETERVVVEERTERRMSQPPPFHPPMPAPVPPRIVTEEEEEDEVVVIEEHSPPRRHSQHRSKRHSRRRSSSASKRESGFREVEPDRFAGGSAPFREVRRSSRHGR